MTRRDALPVRWYLVALFVVSTATSAAGLTITAASLTPTPTVLVYCTPPPCQAGEVFSCPGECPGGCGTQCATPTPIPAHGSVVAEAAAGLPNSTVGVPISVKLDPGVSLATLSFILLVVPGNAAPQLTVPVSFVPATAVPTPDAVNTICTSSVEVEWRTPLDPRLSGTVALGVLQVSIPATGAWQEYDVVIARISATTDASSELALTGVGSHITRCSLLFSGAVNDAMTGLPIAGASVCIGQTPLCMQTDAAGSFDPLCYPGEQAPALCAQANGYEQRCQGGWTPGGYAVGVQFFLSPLPPVSPTPTPTATFCPTGTPCPTGSTQTCGPDHPPFPPDNVCGCSCGDVMNATPTNTPTPTLAPEISITPSTVTLGCEGSFDITITNTGPPGTTLEISSLTLAHGYSQGYYGTGFSWDLSHLTLPASLARGAVLTIPVTFSAVGQAFHSRLELTIDSNALNAPHLFLVYFGASQTDCANTPTPTPTCAPTGTPYCRDACTPCPTIRAGCYASACGLCIPNPTCAADETCLPTNDPSIGGCCSCATVTPTPPPVSVIPSATSTPTPPLPCVGDCDNDTGVTINEIIILVNIALGSGEASACPNGIPPAASVNVALIIQAVNNALNGCPAG